MTSFSWRRLLVLYGLKTLLIALTWLAMPDVAHHAIARVESAWHRLSCAAGDD